MNRPIFYENCLSTEESRLRALNAVLKWIKVPFKKNDSIGVKLHWGEIGNKNFLPPIYAKEIIQWLKENNFDPFVFDNTVLYSGGRREGKQSLKTAEIHNYSQDFLGCPIKIGDGIDGKSVVDLQADYKNFEKVQVGKIVHQADGFIIFSHFKGHMETGFGGAIKNISMGFASRAQKQRMHADAKPSLIKDKCIYCGECVEVCPTGAATMEDNGYPLYDLNKCIGCAQCIAMCPETALKIIWETDIKVFQEKLVETAAAVWRIIQNKTVIINALINIVAECDCLPGNHRSIARDKGFIGAYHPVTADAELIKLLGADCINQTHQNIPWRRQFEYAEEIGFDG